MTGKTTLTNHSKPLQNQEKFNLSHCALSVYVQPCKMSSFHSNIKKNPVYLICMPTWVFTTWAPRCLNPLTVLIKYNLVRSSSLHSGGKESALVPTLEIILWKRIYLHEELETPHWRHLQGLLWPQVEQLLSCWIPKYPGWSHSSAEGWLHRICPGCSCGDF